MAGLGLDPRHLVRPRLFSGEAAGFDEYRFQLTNCLLLVDGRFGAIVDQALTATEPYEAADGEASVAATTLYVVPSAN